MIVDVDIGNTRAKYRVAGSGEILSCSHGDLPGALGQLVPAHRLCVLRVASVAHAQLFDQLAAAFAGNGDVRVVRVRSSRHCAGVTSSYADPDRLGVDRWLAMLAAYNRFRAPCVLIDAGSATTLDVIDGDGFHRGGWICPGLSLLRSSLLQGTAGVRFDPPSQVDMALGCSTAEAVYNGTLAMTVGWLEVSTVALLEKYSNAHIVLSGGNASELRSHLRFAFTAWPDIVLDGLALVPLDQ